MLAWCSSIKAQHLHNNKTALTATPEFDVKRSTRERTCQTWRCGNYENSLVHSWLYRWYRVELLPSQMIFNCVQKSLLLACCEVTRWYETAAGNVCHFQQRKWLSTLAKNEKLLFQCLVYCSLRSVEIFWALQPDFPCISLATASKRFVCWSNAAYS